MMIWRALSEKMAVFTVIFALVAYAYPATFLIFEDIFLWCFAATMFALGVVLKPEDARSAIARPGSIAVGVATQFWVMPMLGFCAAMIATWGGAPPAMALGFIIVGCAPGAMASNVIAYLAGGAVAFSIAMTMIATMLSPMLTPILVELLGSAYMDIPFWPMMQTILLTVVLPLTLGMIVRTQLGHLLKHAEVIAPGIASISIIIICGYAVAQNHERLADTPAIIFILVVLLNLLGYAIGWFSGKVFGFSASYRITLCIEIGMQNAGLGVALALQHFEPETALPGALFAVWCIVTAAGMTRWLHKNNHDPDVAAAI